MDKQKKLAVILLIWLSFLLNGCPSGGGNDNSSSGETTTETSTQILTGASLRLLPNTSTATAS
ncbi:MAG: hypothetical protein BWK79_15690, partial [Beggiatoa sp. IS2]